MVAGVQLGATPFKKIKSAAKRVGKGVAKGTKVVAKAAVDVHKLPIQLMLKAASPAAKVVCGLPPPVLAAAVAAAGLGPTAVVAVPVFCKAVRAGAVSTIAKLLPQMVKIAAAAAAGALTKRTARAPVAVETPSLPEGDIEQEATDAVEDALEGFSVADIDLLGYVGMYPVEVLDSALAGASDFEIRGAVGAPVGAAGVVGMLLGLGAVGAGLWMTYRR